KLNSTNLIGSKYDLSTKDFETKDFENTTKELSKNESLTKEMPLIEKTPIKKFKKLKFDKCISPMEERSKIFDEKMKLKREEIENERRENLERVLSFLNRLSKCHPSEVLKLQEMYFK